MNCAYIIDAAREIVYLVATNDVHPSELICTLRAIKRDPAYQSTYDILAALRSMEMPFEEDDLRVIAYYFGALSEVLQGRFAFVTPAKDLPTYLEWIALIRPMGIKAANYTRLSEAERWIEAKDFSTP